jgi:hypothetical protein
MIIPLLVFWLLLVWSFFDGDLYPAEAGAFALVWFVLLTCFIFLQISPFWFVVPTVLLDVILILKIFGSDIELR